MALRRRVRRSGVLSRVGGQSLEALLRERLLEPLGMFSTGSTVRAEDPAYAGNGGPGEGGGVVLGDPAGADSAYASDPAFPAGSGGPVSTLPEYSTFARMPRSGGVHAGRWLRPRMPCGR